MLTHQDVDDIPIHADQASTAHMPEKLHAATDSADQLGLIVAIIGGDGSGKTTVIEGLCRSLGRDLKISKIHMGVPERSRVTVLVRGALKVWRLISRCPFVRAGSEALLYTDSPIFPGYGWLIYQTCAARDRYHAYLKARAQARRGQLVICDRFPLPQIKLMDGPQVRRVTINCQPNWLIDMLAKLEHKYYQQIQLPNLLMVLKVDPEVAVQRKLKASAPDEPTAIRACAAEILNMDWGDLPVRIIDANRPSHEVIFDLHKLMGKLIANPRWIQPRIIELVGPPGSGKSTLVKTFKARSHKLHIYTSPYFRDLHHISFFIQNLILLLPTLVHMYFLNETRSITRRDIAHMIILSGWDRVLRNRSTRSGTTIVVDEGAIGLLGKLHRFGSFPKKGKVAGNWLERITEQWALAVDLVVELDAPLQILKERIRSREQQYEMQKMTDDEIIQHLAAIRESIRQVLMNMPANPNGPRILHFDTAQLTPQQICDEILAPGVEHERI